MAIKLPFGKQEKSVEELQEENERLELEYSVEEKKLAIAKMKSAGLNFQRDFGGSLKSLIQWWRTH